MIRFVQGDILESGAEALVNTVNTVGVMGKGVALRFKQRFPENYRFYREACKRGEVVPGKMLVFRTGYLQPRYIINFPTKRHWRQKSRIEDIVAGLQDLVQQVRQLGISSIAIPALGCGHGGLEWEEVRPLIENAFARLPEVQVEVYEPVAPKTDRPRTDAPVRLKPAHAALLLLMRQYNEIEPETTLHDVQHIAYLLYAAGIFLFRRQQGGFEVRGSRLYAAAVERLVSRLPSVYLERHRGYRRRLLLSVTDKGVEQARAVLRQYPGVQTRLQRVSKLLEGYESSFALQLLALVMYHRRETVFGQSLDHLLENRVTLFPPDSYPSNGAFAEQLRTVWESLQQVEK